MLNIDEFKLIFSSFSIELKRELFKKILTVDEISELPAAINEVITKYLGHEHVDIFIDDHGQFLIAEDIIEHAENDVEVIQHLYSTNEDDIDEYVKMMLEDGEVFSTLKTRRNFKLPFYRKIKILNVDDAMRPVIPIIYN